MRQRRYETRRENIGTDTQFSVGYKDDDGHLVVCAYADTRDEASMIQQNLQKDEGAQWTR